MLGESVKRRQPRRFFRKRGPQFWKPYLIGVPLALLLPFAIGYLLAVFVLFPPREVSAAGIAVPDLIGRTQSDAQRALNAAGLRVLEVSELPHPSAAAGQVIAQSPLAGQQLRSGSGVQLAVSMGRPRAVVPDVIGFSADRAESLLQRSGFQVTRVMQESEAAAGRVIRTDPPPAENRELPATITMVVSSGPPAVPVDTIVVDTLRVLR